MKDKELAQAYQQFLTDAAAIAQENGLSLTYQNLMTWAYDDNFKTMWLTIFDGVTDEAYDLMLDELGRLGWSIDIITDMEERKDSD